MRFELTKEFLERIRQAIASEDDQWIKQHITDLHFADIAEIMDELSMEQSKYLY
jgi:magnesium transporter